MKHHITEYFDNRGLVAFRCSCGNFETVFYPPDQIHLHRHAADWHVNQRAESYELPAIVHESRRAVLDPPMRSLDVFRAELLKEWQKANEYHSILDRLLCMGPGGTSQVAGEVSANLRERSLLQMEATAAATAIHWLGSGVGWTVLETALRKAGYFVGNPTMGVNPVNGERYIIPYKEAEILRALRTPVYVPKWPRGAGPIPR